MIRPTKYRCDKLGGQLQRGEAQIHGCARPDGITLCWVVYDVSRDRGTNVCDFPCYHVPVSWRPTWARYDRETS